MSTVSGTHGKEAVDLIIKNNGIYPGDEDMPVIRIVEYNNMFNGEVAWGLIYKGDSRNMYHDSPACLNPRTIWDVDDPNIARNNN